FRSRDGTWPGGARIDAEDVAASSRRASAASRGSPSGLDLASIDEIRVMTDRVIEVDSQSPSPDSSTLSAQPELGLPHARQGGGPMAMQRTPQGAVSSLIPPGKRGSPAQEDFARRARSVIVEVAPAEKAVARFNDGYIDVSSGGRIDSSPSAGVGGPVRGNVQIYPVSGRIGSIAENAQGHSRAAAKRAASAMAIDRDALMGAHHGSAWSGHTRIVASETPGDSGTIGERWAGMGIEQRRAAAAERVARWKAAGNPSPVSRIAIGGGPGSQVVFDRLRADFAAIGLQVQRVDETAPADLRSIDSVARYGRATWFSNQLA
ncbi:hypothetical protein OY671_008095, partial [Metschnikowia pulcherrima]